MALKTSHVLIHTLDDESRKQPAILIDNDLILAHGGLLNWHSLGTNPNMLNSLKNYQPYFINKPENFDFYTIYESNRQLYTKSIFLHSVYNVKNLSKNLSRIILKKFKVVNDTENEIFLSTFLVFSLNEIFDYTLVMRKLYDSYIKLNYINVNCLDRIITYSTPFNYDVFHNFVATGYISGTFQDTNSNLFVVDLNKPYNQIGQAIYNEMSNLIGVIIVNSLKYLNDNFSAVFVANFCNIIDNILLQLNLIKNGRSIILNTNRDISIYNKIKNYAILIKNNNYFGSGCFARINNKRFIVTCSHILTSGDPKNNDITCYYRDIKFKIENILFYNNRGKDIKIFDISLLEIPSNISINDNNFAEIKNYDRNELAHKLIYSIGFPQFSIVDEEWNPSVYEGHVVKSKRGVLFTNVLIQAGQSGGPLIDQYGNLIGISILNLKHLDTIYPNLNMAVPICDIFNVLDKYSKTNDVKDLDGLINNDKDIENAWKLENPVINHKL